MAIPPTNAIDLPLRPCVWLRRFAVASVATLLLLAVAWPIVRHLAQRRLDTTLARLRDAGIALKITDLQPAPLEDRENAAWYYKQAFAAISKQFDTPRASNYDTDHLGTAPRFTAFWQTLVERSEIDNAPAFALARQARAHDRVDWGWTFKSPALLILLPTLNDSRHLANTLADGAERSFFVGNSAEGLERIRDILHLARLTSATPFTVTSLVGSGIDALAVDALSPHIGTLRIGDGPGKASRETVLALANELTADEEPMRRMSAAMRTEVTAVLDASDLVRDASRVGRPAIIADTARVAERQLEYAAAADAISNADREARIKAVPLPRSYPYGPMAAMVGFTTTKASGGIQVGRPLTHVVGTGDYDRAIHTGAKTALGRDAAAIALAMRLYELDHAGAWPSKLGDLVPNYLPAIPRNKVSSDDAPYGYQLVPAGLPDGRDRPILVKDGKPIARSRVVFSAWNGPTVELSSLARPDDPTSMPATVPAIPPTTQP